MKHYFQVWSTGNGDNSPSCHRYETIEDMDRLIDFYKHDIKDTLKFWRANLRRAKRYWAMDAEILDKIQDGQVEDITDTEE